MPQFVAFLRAINVGGRSIRMSALAEHFRALGFANVRTFISSGNVIFDSSTVEATGTLESTIERELESTLGFRSEVFVRSPMELRRVASHAGALLGSAPDIQVVNVAFLKSTLDPAAKRIVAALSTESDQLEVRDREIYWMCRTKLSESTFSSALLERKLGVKVTVRAQTMLVRFVSQC